MGKARPYALIADVLGVQDPQGIAFGTGDGPLFILDAANAQIVSVVRHPTLGFDAGKVQRISLKKLGIGSLKGLAYNPGNGHLYVSSRQKKLYELNQAGKLVSSFDLAALGIKNPSAMTFAPSVDNTDDPNIQDLFILDAAAVSTDSAGSSNYRLQPRPPSHLELLCCLPRCVNVIDTSNAAWSPSAPDPAGVDYWPLTNRLLIVDSEVDEMPAYWHGEKCISVNDLWHAGQHLQYHIVHR